MNFTDAEIDHAADQAGKIVVAIKKLYDRGYTIEEAVKRISTAEEIPLSTIRQAIGFALRCHYGDSVAA